ncbi:MAG: hypothetical protein D6758_06170, partial [Gammaproteobacteria bacterium]
HLTCELSLQKTDPWRTLPLIRAVRRHPAGAWHRLTTLSTRTLAGTTELLAGWLSDWLARWTQPGDLFQDTRPEQAHLNTLLKLLTLLEQPPETLVFQHTGNQLHIRALDARHHLQQVLGQAQGCALFSATLQPFEPWQAVYGVSPANTLSLPSPFPADRRCVLTITNLNLRQRHREAHWPAIAHLTARIWQQRPGNYLVFTPTRSAATRIRTLLHQFYPSLPVHLPETADEDHALMETMATRTDTGVVITPLAGRWCEGIDLPADALLGAVVLGTGMPPWDDFHQHRADWAREQGWDGDTHTFVYPGWARVLQALGRVIRTPEDRGVLVLVDDRYARPPLSDLMRQRFPDAVDVKTPRQLDALLGRFWAGT